MDALGAELYVIAERQALASELHFISTIDHDFVVGDALLVRQSRRVLDFDVDTLLGFNILGVGAQTEGRVLVVIVDSLNFKFGWYEGEILHKDGFLLTFANKQLLKVDAVLADGNKRVLSNGTHFHNLGLLASRAQVLYLDES